jgi:dihydroneopterin aldolase
MEESREKSIFNETVNQLLRLNSHWQLIARDRQNGNLKMCRFRLDSVELELFYDAQKLSRENKDMKEIAESTNPKNKAIDYVELIEQVNQELDNNSLELVNKHGQKILQNPLAFYKSLLKKERILREVQQESGKGTKYTSDDDDMNID